MIFYPDELEKGDKVCAKHRNFIDSKTQSASFEGLTLCDYTNCLEDAEYFVMEGEGD